MTAPMLSGGSSRDDDFFPTTIVVVGAAVVGAVVVGAAVDGAAVDGAGVVGAVVVGAAVVGMAVGPAVVGAVVVGAAVVGEDDGSPPQPGNASMSAQDVKQAQLALTWSSPGRPHRRSGSIKTQEHRFAGAPRRHHARLSKHVVLHATGQAYDARIRI